MVVPITSLELGRGVESILRALNNLSEEFHHARPSYILLTPSQVRCPVTCTPEQQSRTLTLAHLTLAHPHTSTPSHFHTRATPGAGRSVVVARTGKMNQIALMTLVIPREIPQIARVRLAPLWLILETSRKPFAQLPGGR